MYFLKYNDTEECINFHKSRTFGSLHMSGVSYYIAHFAALIAQNTNYETWSRPHMYKENIKKSFRGGQS